MMPLTQLSQRLFDQSKDLFWVVNFDLKLIYANKAYQNMMVHVTGEEMKLNNSVFVEGFGEGYVEKWKAYYSKALKGVFFEIEEHFYQPETNEIQYAQITFEPLTGDDNKVFAVACQSKDITRVVKQKSEANQMIDASLDVFCTVNEQDIFLYVSAASLNHWGYTPEELIGTSFRDLLFEEDGPKTNDIIADINSGREINSFVNRYKKKDGGIAYNLWSARRDDNTKLRYAVAKDYNDKIEQEEKIKQSELRFKALVQDGSDLIGILDIKGNYSYVSPTSTHILGIAPEDFTGRNAFEFIHPDDAEIIFSGLRKVITEHRISLEPFRFQNNKQEWRWIETVLTNMLDNPAVKGIVANSRDITEAVNTRKQIEANEIFNRTVLESSPDCFKVLDIEGRIQYMNSNGLYMMDIDNFDDIKGKNWYTLWDSENEKLVKTALDKALKGETAQFTAYNLTAKGTSKWWDVLVSPVGKPGEKIQKIISVSRDITKQKAEEQHLKLLGSVITNTNDAVLITEAEPFEEPGNRIIYVNEAFTKMTGYTAEEVIGKTPRILQGPNSNKEELAALGRKMRNWEPCELTSINYKKNGEEFWVNFALTPVADEKGWYTHWISIERDVTEQKIKELENELLAKVSTGFNAENDYMSAAYEVCKTISKYGNFDLVEVWATNTERSHLQLFSHYVKNHQDEKFYSFSHGANRFTIAESLVGKVWSQQVQLLWDDIENNKDFVRREAAKKIGLKAVLGIPLIFNNETVGVLEIGTKHNVDNLKKYTLLFNKLEGFIGSELNRKKLESDLSHLYDSIPDIIGVGDFKGRVLKINKAGCELLGYSEAQLLYNSFNDFVHPDDINIGISELKNLRSGQSTRQFEIRFINKSGAIVWLSWQCNPSVEEGVIYFTAKNITEEKKLKELNRQTRQLAKIGSWEVDMINQTIYWSDEVHQLHETDPNSFVPDLATAINFYREDFREMVQAGISKSTTEGVSFDFEAVLITAKNNERWVRAIGNAELVDGTCTRFFGSFQDIHERKEAEIRLKYLADNIPGVVYQYLILPDGTNLVRYVSDGATQIWGFTPEQVIKDINLVWNQLKAGGDYEEGQATIRKSIETKSKGDIRHKYVMPNGEVKTHFSSGFPTFLPDGSILYNTITLDITNEVKNEELLKEASKIARLGSWELDLINGDNNMYWSPTILEILELDNDYNPTFTGAIGLHVGESKERVEVAIADLISTGKEYDEELLVKTGKGNERWIRVIGKSVRVNGKCTKIYGSLQDITELKKAEEERNSLLKTLDNSLNEIHIFDAETLELIYVNRGALQNLRYSNDEIGSLNALDIKPEFTADSFKELLAPLINNEKEKIIFFTNYKRKDGSLYPVEIHLQLIKEGNSKRYLAIIMDITDRKMAEDKLIESEQKYRMLAVQLQMQQTHLANAQEVAKVGSWETDLIDLKVTWSDETYRIFGVINDGTNLTHENFLSNVHPSDKEKVDRALKDSVKDSNKSYHFIEHRVLTKDGIEKVVEERWKIDYDDNGIPLLAIGSCQDITERKNAEEEIKFKANLLSTIEQAAIATDLNGVVNYWNKAAETIYGWSSKEAIGQNIINLTTPEPSKEQALQIMEELKKGQTWSGNFKVHKKDGTEFIALVSNSPVYNGDNILSGIIGVSTDISQLVKNEELLKQYTQQLESSNERFEKVTEATNDVIWDWDIVNQTYYRSKAIERFFGKGALELITGKDLWIERFHPDDLDIIKNDVQEALANPLQNRWELEYKVIHENGKTIYVIDRGVIIRNDKGKAIRMVGAMSDISEQKQLAVQLSELNQDLQKYTIELERSNEELEQFAFVASHDLQEPLRMISSFMNQLKRKYENQLDEKAQQYIYFATDGAKRMKQIILDLLQFSRTGRPTTGKEEVDLNEVISEFIQLRRKIISEKNASITFQGLPTLNTYKAAITQIIHCLIDNALKYSKADTEPVVKIKAKENENEWEFSIQDNGIGIDAQFHDKIFIIFQRLHNKEDYEGTGIGLSIAKRHVEFLGGRIWLESAVGKGTTFYFSIPKDKL